MVSLGGSGAKVLAAAKTYYCKICGKSFSSGRVLGGHVRGHQASAASTVRRMMSLVLAEKSESESCRTNRAGDGGCDSWKSPRNYVESFSTGEQKVYSWSSENRCGLCGRGFNSRKALFGHMRIHSGSKRRVKGRSDRCDPSPVVQVSPVVISSGKSVLQKALSKCDIVSPTRRRKRSLRVLFSGSKPINNVPKFSEDEKEAAAGLLMLSTGVVSWKYSGDVKNSSGFLQIGNGVQVLDDLLPGVGDKRRGFGEGDDAAPKKLKVTGYDNSFVIDSNVTGKVTECQTSGDMTCGGIELQSFGTSSSMVEKMRSLVVDALEDEKLPALSSDDELRRGNGERMIPDTCCRKSVLTFERRGYKCRSCDKIFSTHVELGTHWVMSCCSSANPEKTDDEKDNGEGASSPSNANGCDTGLSGDGVGGQTLSGHYWSHGNKESESATSNRDGHGAPLPDLNIPVEVFE